jgi:HK97 family phage portal protein
MALSWLTRSIRPPDDITPNPNDPADVPPATVGPPEARSGDPHGLVLGFDPAAPSIPPPTIRPSAWSGWPAEWWTPNWYGKVGKLTDTAWMCVDLNASILAAMPPYLVGAADTLDSEWLRNPDPDIYSSWEEFAKQLFWDYQLGEAFVLATASYATGWPARFHVVPPWAVNVEMDQGQRRYSIGSVDVTPDILHLRYAGSVDDAHGHGPLEAGAGRLVAAELLGRYATGLVTNGGIPSSIITLADESDEEQAQIIKQQWIDARISTPGAPAVLTGGLDWKPVQLNPAEMALTELAQFNESRIALLLGVPPFLVGLPSGGDPMTYSNITALFLYHWRAGLRPKEAAVMGGLSQWLTPRGTTVELNSDTYIEPEPKTRAETYEIYQRMGALSIDEIRDLERFRLATFSEGIPR